MVREVLRCTFQDATGTVVQTVVVGGETVHDA